MLSSILKERQESVYYSVICDAIPDISQNIRALQEEMQHLRDEWESFFSEASLVAQQMSINPLFRSGFSRQRKRKRFHDETEVEGARVHSANSKFKNSSSKYNNDLTCEFEDEVRHLNSVYRATFTGCLSPIDLLNSSYKMQLQSIFGQVCIVLRIFCTL